MISLCLHTTQKYIRSQVISYQMLNPVEFHKDILGENPPPDVASVLNDRSKDIMIKYNNDHLPNLATKILYLSIYADELDIINNVNHNCKAFILSDSLQYSNEILAHLKRTIQHSKLIGCVKGKMTQRSVTLNWNSGKGHTKIKTHAVGPQGKSVHGIHSDLVVVYNAARLDNYAFMEAVGMVRYLNAKSVRIVISSPSGPSTEKFLEMCTKL